MGSAASTLSNATTTSKITSVATKPTIAPAAKTAAKAVTTIAVSKTSQTLNRASAGAAVVMNISDAVDAYQQNPNGFAAVSITDTSTNMQQNLSILATMANAGKITGIMLTDKASLTIDRNQVSGDLAGANPTDKTIKLLQTVKSAYNLIVKNISVSDALSLKAPKGALLQMKVLDSADNITNNLPALLALQTKASLLSMELTDKSEALTISAAQLPTYSKFLTSIQGSYKLTVNNAAMSDVTKLQGQANVTSIAVSDTGANIQKGIGTLSTLVGSNKIDSIKVTDGALKFTATDATTAGNANFFSANFINGKSNGSPVDLVVTGAIVANITTINDLASENNTLNLTEQVTDTGTHIDASKDFLESAVSQGLVSRITVANTGSNAISFTSLTEYNNDLDAVKKLRGAYTLKIDNMSASDALSFVPENSNANVQLTIADTADNIQQNFDDIQKLAKAGQIEKINVLEGATSKISISATQFGKGTDAIAALTTADDFSLEVTDAKAKDAARIASYTNVKSITFNDTGANIAKSAIALNALDTKLGKITVSDGAINLTSAQVKPTAQTIATNFLSATFDDSNGGAVAMVINGVSVANAKTIGDLMKANSTLTGEEKISDTASNIEAGLSQLEVGAATQMITGLTVKDAGRITVANMADYNAKHDALDLISGVYNLKITKLSLADSASLNAGNSTKLSLGVEDSAANISSGISDLQTLASKGQLLSVKSTDLDAKSIAITAAQVGANSTALKLLSGTYALAVTGATALQAATWSSAANTSFLSKIKTFSIEDTGTNISNKLSDLQTIAHDSRLGSVTVSNGALTITQTQALASPDLAKATFVNGANSGNPVSLTVTDMTLEHLDEIKTQVTANSGLSLKEKFSDTADNIKDGLDQLQAQASLIESISVSDNNTINDVSYKTYSNDSTALGKLKGSFNLNVSGISIADVSNVSPADLGKASFSISDTAANISAHLSDLTQMLNDGKLTSLVSSDNTSKAVSMSAADVSEHSEILALMTGTSGGNFALNITDVKAADAKTLKDFVSGLNSAASISAIDVTDTGAKVMANVSDLQTLAHDNKLGKVTVSDGEFSISEANLSDVSDFLASGFDDGSGGPISVTITDVGADKTAADYAAVMVNGSLKVAGEKVKDTASNIEAKISDLEKASSSANGVDPLVKSITVTDNGTIHIAEDDANLPTAYDATDATTEATAQYTDALKLLSGSYGMSVSGIAVSMLDAVSSNVASNPLMRLSFTVLDSASNLSTAFDDLQTKAANGQIDSINIDPSDTDPITLTADQIGSDSKAIAKLASGTAVKIDDTAQNILDNIADVKLLKANSGVTLTVAPNDSSPPDLTVANMKDIMFVTDSTLGNFTYNISDYVGNILKQADQDSGSILANATAISLKETDPVNLTQAQVDTLNAFVTSNQLSSFDDTSYNLI